MNSKIKNNPNASLTLLSSDGQIIMKHRQFRADSTCAPQQRACLEFDYIFPLFITSNLVNLNFIFVSVYLHYIWCKGPYSTPSKKIEAKVRVTKLEIWEKRMKSRSWQSQMWSEYGALKGHGPRAPSRLPEKGKKNTGIAIIQGSGLIEASPNRETIRGALHERNGSTNRRTMSWQRSVQNSYILAINRPWRQISPHYGPTRKQATRKQHNRARKVGRHLVVWKERERERQTDRQQQKGKGAGDLTFPSV